MECTKSSPQNQSMVIDTGPILDVKIIDTGPTLVVKIIDTGPTLDVKVILYLIQNISVLLINLKPPTERLRDCFEREVLCVTNTMVQCLTSKQLTPDHQPEHQ